MKKSLSILLLILTLITTAYCCTFCAFAESTTKYWEPKHGFQDSAGYVNGEISDNISSQTVPDTDYCKITYGGTGRLIKWEFPTLTENKDYTVISEDSSSITVLWTNEDKGAPYINAIVDFGNETTKQTVTEGNTKADKKETTVKSEAVTKEAAASETTKKPESATEASVENNGNDTSYEAVIICGIVAIILCGAIIAMVVTHKTSKERKN